MGREQVSRAQPRTDTHTPCQRATTPFNTKSRAGRWGRWGEELSRPLWLEMAVREGRARKVGENWLP